MYSANNITTQKIIQKRNPCSFKLLSYGFPLALPLTNAEKNPMQTVKCKAQQRLFQTVEDEKPLF